MLKQFLRCHQLEKHFLELFPNFPSPHLTCCLVSTTWAGPGCSGRYRGGSPCWPAPRSRRPSETHRNIERVSPGNVNIYIGTLHSSSSVAGVADHSKEGDLHSIIWSMA